MLYHEKSKEGQMERLITAIPAYFAPYLISDEPDYTCWVAAILAFIFGGTTELVLATLGVIGYIRYRHLKRKKEEMTGKTEESLIEKLRSFIDKYYHQKQI